MEPGAGGLDEEGRAPEHSSLLLRRRPMRSGGDIFCQLRSRLYPLPAFFWGSFESRLWHSHFDWKIQPEEFSGAALQLGRAYGTFTQRRNDVLFRRYLLSISSQ